MKTIEFVTESTWLLERSELACRIYTPVTRPPFSIATLANMVAIASRTTDEPLITPTPRKSPQTK